MHFFPGIYESKRAKKATSFSNPLTGAFYSNKDFLKNCKNVPRSVSDLDHIKQIKYQPSNEQILKKDRKNAQKKHYMSKDQRRRIQREIVAVHATSRMAQPINKTINESFLLKLKCKKAFDSETIKQIQYASTSKTFASTHSAKFQGISYEKQRHDKKVKVQSHGSTIATFNDIEILILDLLNDKQDFRTKIIRINLQKYYRSFFKKQLSGHFTYEFLNKVQHYIEELYQQQKLDEVIQQEQYPIELFALSSRMTFMNKLIDFETKKTATNVDNIRTLIKYYCVPSKDFRQSCLRDIILMLSLQVFEKFNCSRQEEYILLDQTGHEIKQILQIKFSTKKLYLTAKKHSLRNFNNYIKLLDEFYRQGKKLTFNENIKLNFRNRLAQGNFDDSHFNYTENYEMDKLKRNLQLQNAQTLLKKRIQTHRVNKFVLKQQPTIYYERNQSKTKRIIVNTNNNQLSNEYLQQGTISQLPQKSKLQEQQQFWKMANNKISPQARTAKISSQIRTGRISPQMKTGKMSPQIKTNKNSPSPKRSKSPSKSQLSYKSTSNLSKQKFKQFLNDNKGNSLNASLQKSFKQQFRDFVSKNDIFDFRFNHHFKSRVMKQSLRDYFIYFKDKSDIQIDKIIRAVKSMNIQHNNNEISVNKQIQMLNNRNGQSIDNSVINEQQYESNYNNEERQLYLQNSLTWQQYKNLRISVSCSQPKQVIMSFIAKYLNFNQFGQLSKSQLFDQISIILGQKCQQSIVQVIVQVIWSWFQSNSIIENGFIRRVTLESWYQKYKIVYCMLTSLIFGTNQKTILDLAYQVLV